MHIFTKNTCTCTSMMGKHACMCTSMMGKCTCVSCLCLCFFCGHVCLCVRVIVVCVCACVLECCVGAFGSSCACRFKVHVRVVLIGVSATPSLRVCVCVAQGASHFGSS